jgi:hypothetical protein
MFIRLSTDGSSSQADMDVFVSADGELSHLTCASVQLDFQANAGTTYYFMVSSPNFGGDLVFSVLNLGAPFQVTLRLNRSGTFDPRIGNAMIRGTVTCNHPAEVEVSGQLRQKFRRRIIVGTFFTRVACDGKTPWRAIVRSDQWAFGRGPAEILGGTSGCGPHNCDDHQATAIVRLHRLFRRGQWPQAGSASGFP